MRGSMTFNLFLPAMCSLWCWHRKWLGETVSKEIEQVEKWSMVYVCTFNIHFILLSPFLMQDFNHNQPVLTNTHTAPDFTFLTSLLMPPCCRTILRARLNLATLAMVSAARHFSSLSGESRMDTMVCKPPRSAMVCRIWELQLISFKIFKEPI